VVYGNVVTETWSSQCRGELLASRSEHAAEEAARTLRRIERPEAVDDPDPEPSRQERAVATTPGAVFRKVPAQPRDVVAAVVVDDQDSSAGSQDTLGFSELGPADATKAGPRGDHGIGLTVGQRPADGPARRKGIDAGQPGPGLGEPAGLEGTATDEDDVATDDRSECFERSWDLALDIQGPRERVGERRLEGEREVGHAAGV
jgi:hypothetical protein